MKKDGRDSRLVAALFTVMFAAPMAITWLVFQPASSWRGWGMYAVGGLLFTSGLYVWASRHIAGRQEHDPHLLAACLVVFLAFTVTMSVLASGESITWKFVLGGSILMLTLYAMMVHKLNA
jgi:hypothetical protein